MRSKRPSEPTLAAAGRGATNCPVAGSARRCQVRRVRSSVASSVAPHCTLRTGPAAADFTHTRCTGTPIFSTGTCTTNCGESLAPPPASTSRRRPSLLTSSSTAGAPSILVARRASVFRGERREVRLSAWARATASSRAGSVSGRTWNDTPLRARTFSLGSPSSPMARIGRFGSPLRMATRKAGVKRLASATTSTGGWPLNSDATKQASTSTSGSKPAERSQSAMAARSTGRGHATPTRGDEGMTT